MLAIVKKGGHVQPWHTEDVSTYTPAEQKANWLRLIKILPSLIFVKHKNIERRNRPDPRKLPEGTPLCIADHVWRLFGCGVRGAFGLDQGFVERLVEANDDGVSAKELAAKAIEEYAKFAEADGLAPDLPSGNEWWQQASRADKAGIALKLHNTLGLTQSQIGRRFGVKQVNVSMAIHKAGLVWPPSRDRATPARNSKSKSPEQLLENMTQVLMQLNKLIAASVEAGINLELDTDARFDIGGKTPEFKITVFTPRILGEPR